MRRYGYDLRGHAVFEHASANKGLYSRHDKIKYTMHTGELQGAFAYLFGFGGHRIRDWHSIFQERPSSHPGTVVS